MGNKRPNMSGLKKWQKGQSGNPKGRVKKIPELEKLLADILSEEKNGLSAAEMIIKTLVIQAAKGNIRAAEVLLDRAYGKAKQDIKLDSQGDGFGIVINKIITKDVRGDESKE